MAEIRLRAIIFCQPQAKRFSGELLSEQLPLPEMIEASPALSDDEIQPNFLSSYLRTADVPLAFHRESLSFQQPIRPTFSPAVASPLASTSQMEMLDRLEAFGRLLQYQFSDGKVLTGHQILYHAYSRFVPRHLLPLIVNIRTDLLGSGKFSFADVDRGKQKSQPSPVYRPARSITRPAWLIQAEQVIISTLIAGMRAMKVAEQENEVFELYLTFDENPYRARSAALLKTIELRDEDWGPWRLSTALPEPISHVHYGRARLELDASALGDLRGLSTGFHIDTASCRLMFHTFSQQITSLEVQTAKPLLPEPSESVSAPSEPPILQAAERSADYENETETLSLASSATSAVPRPGLETGISIHLSGHSSIQASICEINDLLKKAQRTLSIHPGSRRIGKEQIKPCLNLSADGSFRFFTKLKTDDGIFQAHGFPQSSAYLLYNLQYGIGATTGFSNNQIAHPRKGLKRERDLKVLRNLGLSALIFFDAANFALGLPLSDGTKVSTEREMIESLYLRIGALILKSEGWPVQVGSLDTLCSSNLTTLIEGFVSQVTRDVEGRDIHLYMPSGEWQVEGLSRTVVQIYHAFLSDIAADTNGACFGKARTKYFENFLSGRTSPEREDLAVRREVEGEEAGRAIYQPVIGDRFIMADASLPPRGHHLLGLLHEGFELSFDGQVIEEFNATDFRPEFTLKDGSAEADENQVISGPKKIDWFELHPKFFFKGIEISADQASRLSREGMMEFGGRLYRVKANDLPSLKRLTQFWSTIQGHNAGLLRGKRRRTEETYFHIPRSQTLDLLALRSSGVKVQGGARWQEICRFYDSLNTERHELVLPSSFEAKLQPYQSSGVQWLRDLHELGLGGILADDMGLGKTVASLAFLESLRAEEKMGTCLVLVPTSLTFNWLSEATRFAPQMPTLIFSSREPEVMLDFIKSKPASVVICTYGLLQENSELFQQVAWNCIIFDEAQNLKNITTKRTTAARRLMAGFKLCLTGTPLENHYGEFYSLFDLTVPGSLGDLASFREKYVNPERVLREDLDYLKLKTKPLILRRTKAQVMHELPPKIETTIKLPFEEEQKRIYRDIATSYNQQIRNAIAKQGEAKSQLQMLTALLRLRQACSDPSAIPGVKYSGEPPKITTLVEALTELTESGASALVFTQFLATYERIRSSLSKAKIVHYDINGADSRLAREKKLQAFKDDEIGSVMLMTLKTGGVGLNLTKASYIFHVEPWWNPAVENQATDRAHRIGQSRTVQVYRYLIQDSVEEKIEILKAVKSRKFDALFSTHDVEGELDGVSEKNVGGGALSQQDFEYLLS